MFSYANMDAIDPSLDAVTPATPHPIADDQVQQPTRQVLKGLSAEDAAIVRQSEALEAADPPLDPRRVRRSQRQKHKYDSDPFTAPKRQPLESYFDHLEEKQKKATKPSRKNLENNFGNEPKQLQKQRTNRKRNICIAVAVVIIVITIIVTAILLDKYDVFKSEPSTEPGKTSGSEASSTLPILKPPIDVYPPHCITLAGQVNIVIHCHGMNAVPSFPPLNTAKYGYMYDNTWAMIPAGAFGNLSRLTVLDLGSSKIATLNPQAFAGLSHLENLSLSHNDIQRVDSTTFNNLLRIKQIYLDHNAISELHEQTFTKLAAMLSLDLSRNKIERIPTALLKDMAALKNLHFEHNRLKVISQGTFVNNFQHGDVVRVYLSSNNIDEIQEGAFHQSATIEVLDLASNPIECNALEHIPRGITIAGIEGCGVTYVACPGGFTGSNCATDIDECNDDQSQIAPCPLDAVCINTRGSYICQATESSTVTVTLIRSKSWPRALPLVLIATVFAAILGLLGWIYNKHRNMHATQTTTTTRTSTVPSRKVKRARSRTRSRTTSRNSRKRSLR